MEYFFDPDEFELTCPICGKETYKVYGKYPRKDNLCKECSQKLFNGEIEQCKDCGKWNKTGSKCYCKREKENSKENVIVISPENKSRCITCGKKTDGLLFCSKCYSKYNKKELLFRITGCSSVELLDEDYEGRYTCKDGHVVKSKSEREIDNFLFERGISHAYEKELPYGKNEKETLHPDFYLPNYLGLGKHVYIEHWGYNENNIQYEKTKKFKLPIYEKMGVTLVCTYEKSDASNIEAALERKLTKANIEEGKIN